MKSILVSLNVFVMGLAISFVIAILIKALMSSIRYIFSKFGKAV